MAQLYMITIPIVRDGKKRTIYWIGKIETGGLEEIQALVKNHPLYGHLYERANIDLIEDELAPHGVVIELKN